MKCLKLKLVIQRKVLSLKRTVPDSKYLYLPTADGGPGDRMFNCQAGWVKSSHLRVVKDRTKAQNQAKLFRRGQAEGQKSDGQEGDQAAGRIWGSGNRRVGGRGRFVMPEGESGSGLTAELMCGRV